MRNRAAALLLAFVCAAAPGLALAEVNEKIRAVLSAADEDSPDHLRELLLAGGPVNSRGPRGQTALQVAAARGQAESVEMLLIVGADINAIAAGGSTALGWAARKGHETVVRILLDKGAEMDLGLEPADAPLPLAVAAGHVRIVRLLLERGSKAFVEPGLAAASLIAAGDNGDSVMAAIVVPPCAGLLEGSPAMLHAAADAVARARPEASATIVRLLGEPATKRRFHSALLIAAARRDRNDLAAQAIANGADVNTRHPRFGSALRNAVAHRNSDIVGLLVSAGADTTDDDIPEEKLVELAGDAIAERRRAANLGGGASAGRGSAPGALVLFRAAQRGDFAAVENLLGKGADPNATVERWAGDAGWTALMAAAASGYAEVAERLISAGATVDQRNGAGRTALAFAAWYGRSAVIAVLLEAGADHEAADHLGLTPRSIGEAAGEPASIQMLRRAASRKAP
ncbi:MAG: ankyrin repeat domain-containing protein [Candidatus Binatia bacterium]